MADLNKILANAAETDMRRARKTSALMIYGTQNGLLDLTYTDGIYRLVTQMTAYEYMTGKRSIVLAEGPARIVKPVLMAQYTITYA